MQYYGPELEQRLRQHLKPTNKSWRVDETYVRVKGCWCYLYRAIDSRGATIDFLLSALRDADAAKRLFRKALGDRSHPQPRAVFKILPVLQSLLRRVQQVSRRLLDESDNAILNGAGFRVCSVF